MFTNLDKEMKASVFPHNMAPHVDLVIGGMANIFLFGYSFGGVSKFIWKNIDFLEKN